MDALSYPCGTHAHQWRFPAVIPSTMEQVTVKRLCSSNMWLISSPRVLLVDGSVQARGDSCVLCALRRSDRSQFDTTFDFAEYVVLLLAMITPAPLFKFYSPISALSSCSPASGASSAFAFLQ